MYDPNHTLSDLPKIASVGDILADFEKILKMKNQYLKNKILCRFYVKWKNYPEEEGSGEREVNFKMNYYDFDIEDNDF